MTHEQLRGLAAWVEYAAELGVEQLGSRSQLAKLRGASSGGVASSKGTTAVVKQNTRARTVSGSLETVLAELGDCKRCRLSEGRQSIVFGSGSPTARLMFVGEAPGYHEDVQGLPFVGPAGQLLSRMIGAMGFSRDDVYIANIIKCRPPENRNPQSDEIQACVPFLEKQIAAIQPEVLVTLGNFATQTLLDSAESAGKLRGRLASYQGIALMPTYHPAFLLRSPGKKKETWQHLQEVMALLGNG